MAEKINTVFLSRTIYGVSVVWVKEMLNGLHCIDQWFEINGHRVNLGFVDMESYNAIITQPKSWYETIAKRYR